MDPVREALSASAGALQPAPPRTQAAESLPSARPRPRLETAYEAFQARARFAALDGLRALSILAVLWHHTAGGLGALPASANGFLGVDMFFVLSGFLIVTLILRERARTGELSLRRFYARRMLRIFPPYYLVLGCVLLLVTLRPDSAMRAPFLAELPFHLTYTSNWIRASTFLALTWSLSAEEQFYVLWPPIEKFFARRVVPVLLGVLLVNQLVNFGLLDGFLARTFGLERSQCAILQTTFTPICLGVLLAHGLADRRIFARLHGLLAWRGSAWILLVLLAAACNVPGDLSGLPRLVIQLTMALLLAALVVEEEHALVRLLTWPALARIGVISYGMYLYHQFARHAAESLQRALGFDSPLVLFALCTLLTIAFAEASFRWFETPLARLRGSFSSERSRQRGRLVA